MRNSWQPNSPFPRRTLRREDIVECAVVWFESDVLNSRRDLVLPPSLATGCRPFLCLEEDEARSCWIELTLQRGRDRFLIPAAARKGGWGKWRDRDSYVNDPRSTYVGPHEAFIAAASDFDCPGTFRPCVELSIVREILAEVVTCGGAHLDSGNPRVPRRPAA